MLFLESRIQKIYVRVRGNFISITPKLKKSSFCLTVTSHTKTKGRNIARTTDHLAVPMKLAKDAKVTIGVLKILRMRDTFMNFLKVTYV